MRRVWLFVAIFTLPLVNACGRAPYVGTSSSPSVSTASSPRIASPTPTPARPNCPVAEMPSARSSMAMAYAQAAHEGVLFGGEDSSNRALGDTWVWKSGCWTQLQPSPSPPAAYSLASAYDKARGTFMVYRADLGTWIWDGQKWTSPSASRPQLIGQAAYDESARRILMFGMSLNGGAAQTWTWDGSNWTQVGVAISPAARFDAGMVFDPALQRVLLFGGINATNQPLEDTWSWDGANWAQLSPKTSPPARGGAAITAFAAKHIVVLIGGYSPVGAGRMLADVWIWDGANWSASNGIGPVGSASAIDTGPTVLVFGGASDQVNATNRTWTWDGANWSAS